MFSISLEVPANARRQETKIRSITIGKLCKLALFTDMILKLEKKQDNWKDMINRKDHQGGQVLHCLFCVVQIQYQTSCVQTALKSWM